ncbi:hypothetical protein CYY_007705 [Polysphondylium violaceum]|uniref:Nuclear condensin complex subunit 3 C-terminal domain-containing protein n=1 Tax=Polysphondylium violaceum TaxID=133409 RepID=A0A8J4PPZ5_9MYCE|nr:hypothetical protein CYY_007705 [Polysphondylium violaceum]
MVVAKSTSSKKRVATSVSPSSPTKLTTRKPSTTTTSTTRAILTGSSGKLSSDDVKNDQQQQKQQQLVIQIQTLFLNCQKSIAYHKKSIQVLLDLLVKCSSSTKLIKSYIQIISSIVDRVLAISKRDPPIERVVKFVCNFISTLISSEISTAPTTTETQQQKDSTLLSNENENENNHILLYDQFFNRVMNHLIERCNSKDKSVRFRSTLMIGEVLNSENLREDYEFDEQLWGKLVDTMMDKSKDRIPGIRKQSIYSLSRMQDTSYSDDIVTLRLIELLKFDTSPDVRNTVLQNIIPTKKTLQSILEKTLDINPIVRKQSFLTIGQKIEIKFIPISLRMGLLKNGLQERDKLIQDSCSNMLLNCWLEKTKDILKLLEYFNVEFYEEETELGLMEIFSKGKFGVENCKEFDLFNLSKEQAIYIRVLSQYLKKKEPNNFELLDSFLPSIIKFNDVLLYYLSKSEQQDQENNIDPDSLHFIQSQLILVAQCLDYSDEAGRDLLSKTVKSLILSIGVDDNHLDSLIELLYILHPNPNEYISIIISSLNQLTENIHSQEESDQFQLEQENRLEETNEKLVELEKKKEEIKKSMKSLLKSAASPNIRSIIDKLKDKLTLVRQEYSEQLDLKNEITDSLNIKYIIEQKIWVKTLTILSNFLKHLKISFNHKSISKIINLIKSSCLNHKQTIIVNMAIKVLGMFCLTENNPKDLHDNIEILLELLNKYENQILSPNSSSKSDLTEQIEIFILIIQSLFDILLWYGYKLNSFLYPKKPKQQQQQESLSSKRKLNDDGNNHNSDSDQDEEDDDQVKYSFDYILNRLLVVLKNQQFYSSIQDQGSNLDETIQLTLVEGISKIIYNQIYDPNHRQSSIELYQGLFSYLVFMFFNQNNQGKPIQQVLSSFFNIFVISTRDFNLSSSIIEESFLPSLLLFSKSITEQQSDSKPTTSSTTTSTMVKFFIWLTNSLVSSQIKYRQQQLIQNQSIPQEERKEREREIGVELVSFENQVYFNFVYKLSLETLSDTSIGKNYCKLFGLFQLDSSVPSKQIKQLLFLASKMLSEIRAKTFYNQLFKYHQYLVSLDLDKDSHLSDADQDHLNELVDQFKQISNSKSTLTKNIKKRKLNNTSRSTKKKMVTKKKSKKYSSEEEEEEEEDTEDSSSEEEEKGSENDDDEEMMEFEVDSD